MQRESCYLKGTKLLDLKIEEKKINNIVEQRDQNIVYQLLHLPECLFDPKPDIIISDDDDEVT